MNEIIKLIAVALLALAVMTMITKSVLGNRNYDKVEANCDMKGILSGTNVSKLNLTACNYYKD